MAGLDDLKNERSFLMHGNLLLKMDHFLDESATFARSWTQGRPVSVTVRFEPDLLVNNIRIWTTLMCHPL